MSHRQPGQPGLRRAAASEAMAEAGLLTLTPSQWQLVRHSCESIRALSAWSGTLPVLLLERCWLRLSSVPVQELAVRLPPDCSHEAPELVRYRQLLREGHQPLQAQQLCWLDFGMEACHEAQRRYWGAQERGNHGWTMGRYLALLEDYRTRLQAGSPRPLPLLVLARGGESPARSVHQLLWLGPTDSGSQRSMRDTCA